MTTGIFNRVENIKDFYDEKANSQTVELFVGLKKDLVFLKCPDYVEHKWSDKISNVKYKATLGCRFCSMKEYSPTHSIGNLYPHLVEEFSSKNGGDAYSVTAKGSVRYIWECSQGHEWEAPVRHRIVHKSGCPGCSGRVATKDNSLLVLMPELALELNEEKSGFTAKDVKPGSERYGIWNCTNGHEYRTMVYSRAKLKTKCPICTNQRIDPEVNSLLALRPELAAQLNEEKSGFKASEVGAGALKYAIWNCSNGHEWRAYISNRSSQDSECPDCILAGTSRVEIALREALRKTGFFDKVSPRQVTIKGESQKYSVDMIAELKGQKIVIEYDGSYYHKNLHALDTEKTKFFIKEGYIVVRVREDYDKKACTKLGYSTPGFFQISYKYSTKQEKIDTLVQQVINIFQ